MTSADIAAREAEDIRRATERRLAKPNARPGERPLEHVQVTDCLRGGSVSKFCGCYHCTLGVCKVCGAYEGGLTSECPGEYAGYDTTLAVYKTDLDYTTERGWHLTGQPTARRPALFASTEPALTTATEPAS